MGTVDDRGKPSGGARLGPDIPALIRSLDDLYPGASHKLSKSAAPCPGSSRRIQAAGACAREPVADLLTGGGVDRRGPSPGREVVTVGEAPHVPDIGQDAGCAGRSDRGQVHHV